MAGDASLIGTRVGNYEITALIGSGGMGDVYKATHVIIGAKVAVKVLRATTDTDAEGVERFMREAKAVNRISHDRVIKIMDAGQLEDRRPYLIMEWLDGQSLHERLRPGEPMPMTDACTIIGDVLDVVAAAHQADIGPRDLKPANIFLTASGRTIVLDFGIARLLETNRDKGLTQVGVVIGTPSYMAPEQMRGQPVGPETDVYALGITLYQLITGVRPFAGGSSNEALREQLEDLPMAPTMWAADLLPSVEAVIMKALAKKATERYRNASEMRVALQAALPTQAAPPAPRVVPALPPDAPTLAPPPFVPTPAANAPRPPSRAWRPIAAASAVAVAAIVGVVAWTRHPPPTPPLAATPPPAAGHAVATRHGPVLAEEPARPGVAIYRGIPFARPPVGELRWQPPRPPAAWTTPRPSRLSTPCMQSTQPHALGVATRRAGDPDPAEDCLYLDVYAPADAARLPVVVFIHGGNHIVGSNHDLDGAALAAKAHVVVVMANYRLNVFGWLALAALGDPTRHGASGNYGLLDQIAALAWVQDNIDAFGGRPDQVLVAGQSAGAVDACDLLTSARAKGLFSRLWLMSGGCYALPSAPAQEAGTAVATAMQCADQGGDREVAACLRGKSASELLQVPGASSSNLATQTGARVSFVPVIDGDVLAGSPAVLVRDGAFAHMPVVVGSTADELKGWVGEFSSPVTSEASYKAALLGMGVTEAVAAYTTSVAYPSAAYGGDPSAAFGTYLSDALSSCPARRTANDLAAREPGVRRYLFEAPWSPALGAGHGADLLFAFGEPSARERSAPLVEALMAMLGRFAADGDPGVAEWPAYTPADPRFFSLDVTSHPAATDPAPHAALCAQWDRYAYEH